jgi:hypothetical protein
MKLIVMTFLLGLNSLTCLSQSLDFSRLDSLLIDKGKFVRIKHIGYQSYTVYSLLLITNSGQRIIRTLDEKLDLLNCNEMDSLSLYLINNLSSAKNRKYCECPYRGDYGSFEILIGVISDYKRYYLSCKLCSKEFFKNMLIENPWFFNRLEHDKSRVYLEDKEKLLK